MFGIKNPELWFIGVVVVAVAALLARDLVSGEARARRRREKSHRPLISRKPGPSVTLAVDVDKPGRRRKG